MTPTPTATDGPALPEPQPAWRRDLELAARRLAVLTLVGAAAGMVVVGVLGRLGMSLLAALNPAAAGMTSNDGFEIGQFTLAGSAQLLAAGLQFGLLGVFGYTLCRGLMVGPRWFRLASISWGPAIVVVAIVVEPHGVDFTRLHPLGLSIAIFTALPALFVAALHLGAERWLPAADGLRAPLVALGLLPWAVLLPLTLVLLAGWAALRGVRRTPSGRRVLDHEATAWLPRAVLTGIFVVAVGNLVGDVATLT